MRLVLGSASNPLFEQLLLLGSEDLMGFCRGHDVVGVSRGDPSNKFAGLGFAGDDRWLAVLSWEDRLFEAIQAKVPLPRGGIRAVAREAVLRKNGPDVAVELRGECRRQTKLGDTAQDCERDKCFFHPGHCCEY